MHDLRQTLTAEVDSVEEVTPSEVYSRARHRGRRVLGAFAALAMVAAAAMWTSVDREPIAEVRTTAPASSTTALDAASTLTTQLADDPSVVTAVFDDVIVEIRVEQPADAVIALEVGTPTLDESDSPANVWFSHPVVARNRSDGPAWLEHRPGSRLLGDPPALLVGEPGCGYSWLSKSPDEPVLVAGACTLAAYSPTLLEAGEASTEAEWSAYRDLRGMAPGRPGTFTYEKRLRYRLADEVEPREHTVSVVYEIVALDETL